MARAWLFLIIFNIHLCVILVKLTPDSYSRYLCSRVDKGDMDRSIRREPFGLAQSIQRNIAWATGLCTPYPGIPHMPGHWKEGRLPSLLHGNTGIQDNLAEAAVLARAHPSGMVSFWVENNLFLLITKPEDVHDFKIRCHDFFNRQIPYFDLEFPGESLVLSNGAPGLKLRKAYKKVLFDSEPLQAIEGPTADFIEEFIDHSITPSTPLNSRLFRDFVLKLSARLFIGMDSETVCRIDNGPALDYLDRLFQSPLVNSINSHGLKDDPIPVSTGQMNSAEWNKYRVEMLAEFRALFVTPYEEIIKDSTGHLLHDIWNLSQKENCDFTAEVFFLIVGGLITTMGDAFPLVIQQISSNPEVEAKLEVFLEQDELGECQDYMDLVVKETLRFSPPGVVILARRAEVPFYFRGLSVNAGDRILISPYVNHKADDVWENPTQFIPERFLSDRTIPKGAYIPFGSGPRDCIGRHYAAKVLNKMLVKLYYKFHVTVLGAGEATMAGVSSYQPLQLRFEPRMKPIPDYSSY